jgi:hypothetical protein
MVDIDIRVIYSRNDFRRLKMRTFIIMASFIVEMTFIVMASLVASTKGFETKLIIHYQK